MELECQSCVLLKIAITFLSCKIMYSTQVVALFLSYKPMTLFKPEIDGGSSSFLSYHGHKHLQSTYPPHILFRLAIIPKSIALTLFR